MTIRQRFNNFMARQFGLVPHSHLVRAYASAKHGRLLGDWIAQNLSASEEVKGGLVTTRNRSRELERDNDYGLRYFNITVKNIVGDKGVKFQSKARMRNGKDFDKAANATIEAGWAEWGKVGHCTADRRKSWIDCQNLAVRSVARDGEILARMVKGFGNKHRFALQFIESDQLDHELNDDPNRNGAKVRMGVEHDEWNAPVAYWILTTHPGDYIAWRGKKYTRIPAAEIIHLGIEERENQTRYMPWLHTAMSRLHMLGGYEEAELVAARAAACKFGTIETPIEYQGQGNDSEGNTISEFSAGQVEELLPGQKFELQDPTHPGAQFSPFTKSMLRGAAAGGDVSYNKLANDLEGVTFSSLREGNLDERDSWKCKQTWLIEHFCQIVFEAWLEMFLTVGMTDLRLADYDRLNAPLWQARRWAWVDPLKDMLAEEKAVANHWRTDTQAAANLGNDYETNLEEIDQEQELRKANNIVDEPDPTVRSAVVIQPALQAAAERLVAKALESADDE